MPAPKSPSRAPAPAPSLRAHPHLYEINTWAWLEELSLRSKRSIKLASVPDAEWDSLVARGFDIVWLMGVWKRSRAARRVALEPAGTASYADALPGWKPKDVVGSPYAVAEYTPDPRIGDWDALDRVREKLRKRGMSLFLDFVGNHTALDHPWTRKHPEFYVQGTKRDFDRDPSSFLRIAKKGGPTFLALARDLYFPPWRDAAQLNHFHPGMRAAQLDDLRTIAAHCDGVRCDMAMLQLNDIFAKIWTPLLDGEPPPATEFWTEARAAVPKVILLAEAYWGTEQRLLDLGIAFAYDKVLYDAVRDANVDQVRASVAAPLEVQSRFARFLENHDEARCAATFGARLPAAGTLMSTLPGMRLYHQGELEGRKIHLPIQLRMAAAEPPDPAAVAFFDKVLRTTNEAVFHEGQWSLLPVMPEGDGTSGNLIVYEWRSEKAWKMIVVNLSANPSQGRVHLGDRVSPTAEYTFDDQLNDVRYPRHGEELHNIGLFVRRDGFQAHLFDITSA